ncbi:hypothetical protein SAMN04488103_11430 [Gemmobacter aquatilis]|uniref:Uncharacterized protein n=1 Tax=Gemmobacter aquatilis TaxID=933059 RepID=A0A1H8MQP4_9RHOB|nr:hypothetical protein [Gemmobacter aquatilis]SEO19590.1 hypothetical protein SAMN04488103_11430 [Gemmobacter aquatilis]
MAKHVKAQIVGGALVLIGVFSTALGAETLAPPDAVQEEAFLDVLPKVEVPENVQLIPGAVNEEFRNCESSWPASYALARSGPEARALRDIYGLVRVRNVIETQNCGCAGKVANWEDVEVVAAALREQYGVEKLSWQQTEAIAEEAAALTAVAETMCGGSF